MKNPFSGWDNSDGGRRFYLRQFSRNGFTSRAREAGRQKIFAQLVKPKYLFGARGKYRHLSDSGAGASREVLQENLAAEDGRR